MLVEGASQRLAGKLVRRDVRQHAGGVDIDGVPATVLLASPFQVNAVVPVPIAPGRADGDVNRMIETAVTDIGGHKSLYSDAYYDKDGFWARYGGAMMAGLNQRISVAALDSVGK